MFLRQYVPILPYVQTHKQNVCRSKHRRMWYECELHMHTPTHALTHAPQWCQEEAATTLMLKQSDVSLSKPRETMVLWKPHTS